MTKAYLISDNSDGSNWGCYATSRELRKLVNKKFEIEKSVFLKELKYKDRRFNTPSTADVKYVLSEYIKILTNSNSFPKKIYDFGIQGTAHFWDYLPKTAEQFKSKSENFTNSRLFNKYLSGISEDNHVIINGEGSIHGNRRKSQMLLFLAYVAKHEIGAKTHIVNHTLQIDTPELQEIVELVYPTLDTVAFRDPMSVDQYNSKIGKGNVVTAADAAWLSDNFISKDKLNELSQLGGLSVWTPHSEPEVNFNDNYICIGGGSGFSRSDEEVAKGFIDLVQQLQKEFTDYNIILTAAASSDETFMLMVSERTGAPLVKLNNDVRVAASVVSNSNLYLGGRWHPTIFALLGGAQIVSFQGNTFKMESIKQQLNSGHPIYQTQELFSDRNDILNSAFHGLNQGFDNIPLSENKINHIRNKVERNVLTIK